LFFFNHKGGLEEILVEVSDTDFQFLEILSEKKARNANNGTNASRIKYIDEHLA